MEKALNKDAIEEAMRAAGLNRAQIAREIGVSRAAVTKWMNQQGFPRPDKLLKLGLLLDLGFGRLVKETASPLDPVVAFRRKGGRKTKEDHLRRARDMALLLRHLAPLLPFDELSRPATLRNPVCDYFYVQKVARKIREEINLPEAAPVHFRDLLDQFAELHAVIVPVLWGDKTHHENALHIYLPDSMTTWVYLNLDSKIPDFKFWMAHELAHAYAPDLLEDEGEDFADPFAQALLFPERKAKKAYASLKQLRGKGARITCMKDIANEFGISPTTVNLALQEYARVYALAPVDVGQAIHPVSRNVNKASRSVAETLFSQTPPGAKEYISVCRETFESPFFDALQQHLRTSDASTGFVETILQLPLRDAKEIVEELR